ncbi:MAG TPA: RNA polymerase sigma factor RpoD/SigA [Chitinophagaceae bacterium]|jgi:RNA polymerase primary sigma factor|nr:RNA polymerase sigma factor RpoD/SigA [Chitinophagaceae bacterium]
MRQLVISKSITNRESQSLEKYLNEIRKLQLLTPDEEINLFSLIKKGDQKALERLVNANLRFVVSVAKQYQNQGLSLCDLINEGNLGLIRAARHFDDTKGFKFISYAVWWIRQHIIHALKEQGRLIRMPSNKIALSKKIQKTNDLLEQELGRPATEEELAKALNIEVKEISLSIMNNNIPISLDSPISEDEENTMIDSIENPNAEKTDKKLNHTESLKTDLEISFRYLTDIQKETVCRLFGIGFDYPMNLDQIGEVFNLSTERMRQIKEKAFDKLRTMENFNLLRRYLTA